MLRTREACSFAASYRMTAYNRAPIGATSVRHRVRNICFALGLACAALSVACGGSSDGGAPPPIISPITPVTPTVGTVPASLSIVAGDGQSGEPGATLPVKPSAVVKDAAGLTVAGATVSFAVDSGGGTLDALTAVSDANGVAGPGNWKLGAKEGRNVMHASVTTVPSAKFVATSAIVPVSLPVQTVAVSGGSVVVARAGSPIDGMTISVPSGSFTTALQVLLSYKSSVAMPRVADIAVASPIVTVATNATGASQQLYTITMPASIADDEFPIIAMVNPSTGFLDALQTTSYDRNGVTAVGTIMDETQLVEDGAASSAQSLFGLFTRSALNNASPQMQLAVLVIKQGTLYSKVIDTGFQPGVDDWEFDADETPVYASTSPGEAVTARFYFRTRKSLTSGSLWKKFQKAPNAIGSDVAGIQWNAGISKQFMSLVPPYVTKAEAGRAANQVQYDRYALQSIVTSMIASSGAPQIVGFDNQSTHVLSTVLAYKWDGPAGLLYDANPEFPGNATRKSTWSASTGFNCGSACVAVAGLNHLIGYQSQLNAEYAQVADGSINKSLFPKAFISSRSAFIAKTIDSGFDTLFVVDDTARVWVECPTCTGQFPTSLPLQHGAAGIQSQRTYYETSPGQYTKNGVAQTSTGFLFNIKQFPSTNTNNFADFMFGIEGRGLVTTDIGANARTGWIGWKQYRVIKYAPKLTVSSALPGVPVTFALSSEGGPALPANASYQFVWGDGTNTMLTSRPAAIQHTYDTKGTYLMKLKMMHAPAGESIGALTATVQVRDGQILWRLQTADITSAGPRFVGTSLGDTLWNNIVVDAMNRIRNAPGDAFVVSWTGTDTLAVVLQLVDAGKGSTVTGFDATALRFVVAAPPTMTLGQIGSGVVTGSAQVVGGSDPVPGLLNTINATMIPGQLLGSITIGAFGNGVGPTYTIRFTAVQFVP
jgi:hypothetical protein